MTCDHVGDEGTVRDDLSRGTTTQGFDHKLFHIVRQLSLYAQEVPCTILKDVTQPAAVRFFELDLGPGEGGLGIGTEWPIDDVKC